MAVNPTESTQDEDPEACFKTMLLRLCEPESGKTISAELITHLSSYEQALDVTMAFFRHALPNPVRREDLVVKCAIKRTDQSTIWAGVAAAISLEQAWEFLTAGQTNCEIGVFYQKCPGADSFEPGLSAVGIQVRRSAMLNPPYISINEHAGRQDAHYPNTGLVCDQVQVRERVSKSFDDEALMLLSVAGGDMAFIAVPETYDDCLKKAWDTCRGLLYKSIKTFVDVPKDLESCVKFLRLKIEYQTNGNTQEVWVDQGAYKRIVKHCTGDDNLVKMHVIVYDPDSS